MEKSGNFLNMNEIFERYKKIIISVAGVMVFLIAGILTMMLKPVEKFEVPQPQPQEQIQNQTQAEPEKQPEIKIQEDWYIHVAGEVKNPGVYKLSQDSRIFQAIDKAGGFTVKADRDSINLAEKIASDGLQIYIAPKEIQNNNFQVQQPQQQSNNFAKIPGVPQTRRTSNATVTA